MALIVCGTQGVGKNTFTARCNFHGIATSDMWNLFLYFRRTMKASPGHHHITGPYTWEIVNGQVNTFDEMTSHFPYFYESITVPDITKDITFNVNNPVFTGASVVFAKWLIENKPDDGHKVILITAPEETQCLRLFEREKTRDPRLIGKSNSYQLVKPEFLKEFAVHAEYVTWLETNAEYHIYNDGTLEQYNAAIDTILNECNLLE